MTPSAHRARTAQHTGSWARTGFALLVSFRPASANFLNGGALGTSARALARLPRLPTARSYKRDGTYTRADGTGPAPSTR